MSGLPFVFVIGAVALEALFVFLLRSQGTPVPVISVILTLIAANTVYLLTVWAVLRSASTGGDRNYLPSLIIGFALIFRLTCLPVPAPLTDDLFRYRWEGRIQAHGGNPYASRPLDAKWSFLKDETWGRIGQKDVPAGYGPATELLSAVTWRMAAAITDDPFRQALLFKVPAALFELATIPLLLWWLRLRGLPPERILIYAWSPLPIWEFWASGHNDAPVLFFLVLALVMAERRRWVVSWSALGMSIALKLWPAILIPAWFLRTPRLRWLMPALPLAIFGIFSRPYIADVSWNLRYMSGFVGGWRNNDSLFGIIFWLMGGDQYRAKYLAFALIAALALWFARRRSWPLERITLWTIVWMLWLSSNCHPWYLTWFIPFLVFEPILPLLLWTALMPLSYSVWILWSRAGIWEGSTPLRWLVYGPVFVCLAVWHKNVNAARRTVR